MLSRRQTLALATGQAQRADQRRARLARLDHVIHIAALGRDIRVGEAVLVIFDQLGHARRWVGRFGQLLAKDDLDRRIDAHHSDLGRRPGRNPGTSTNVTSGRLKASQKRTKRAAFTDESMSSVPARCAGWLATIPTGKPSNRAKPTTILRAQKGCTSKNTPSSTTASITATIS